MLTQTKAFPKVSTFREARYYIFSAVFVSSAVFFPWLTHQFHIAGPKFLPMQFFVLVAGFLFGWRNGLIIGFVSPMLSYAITQMPSFAILPETMLELAVYGLVIGILREKRFHILVALLPAMVSGRLARLVFVLGLGLGTDPLKYFQMSWPGILLQLALVPMIICLSQKFLFKGSEKTI